MPNVGVIPCPHCNQPNNAHTNRDLTVQPADGDVSICWNCGNLAVFYNGGEALRFPTVSEAIEISNNNQIREMLKMQAQGRPVPDTLEALDE